MSHKLFFDCVQTEKGVKMVMAQMGRPKEKNPKLYYAKVRLTKEEAKLFNAYCERNGVTTSGVLRAFILGLIGNKKDNQ